MTAILALHPQAPAQPGLDVPTRKSMTGNRPAKPSSPGSLEKAEYRLIFAVYFVALLLEAIAARAMPWGGAPAGEPRKSVFAQARAATERTMKQAGYPKK